MPSKVNCIVSKIHNTVVMLYNGLRLSLKSMLLRYLMPIKLPAADKKKAHSLMMSRVNKGSAGVPSIPVSLPLVISMSSNRPKARLR